MESARLDITALLLRWNSGDRQALEQLTPVIYDELRRMARAILSQEREGHTLSATALVHEAYLKLVDQRRVNWENRAHFFLRRISYHAAGLGGPRAAKSAAKRGSSATRIPLKDDVAQVARLAEEILGLDEALDRLSQMDQGKAQVVEMKFFAGMTNQETPEAPGTSDATVDTAATLGLGGGGSISNSQCTLSGGSTPASSSGNNLTVPFTITFKSGFTAATTIWGLSQTYAGTQSNGGTPTTLGTWTP